MKCSCRGVRIRFSGSNRLVCGERLKGEHCRSDVIYQCRTLGFLNPIEHCPNGCLSNRTNSQNVRCRSLPSTTSLINEERVEKNLDDLDHKTTMKTTTETMATTIESTTKRYDGLEIYEEEFVTFDPFFHVFPRFDP